MIDYSYGYDGNAEEYRKDMEKLRLELQTVHRRSETLLAEIYTQGGEAKKFFELMYVPSCGRKSWKKWLPSYRQERKVHKETWMRHATRLADFNSTEVRIIAAYGGEISLILFSEGMKQAWEKVKDSSQLLEAFAHIHAADPKMIVDAWFNLLKLVSDNTIIEIEDSCSVDSVLLVSALTGNREEALVYAELPDSYLYSMVESFSNLPKKKKKSKKKEEPAS